MTGCLAASPRAGRPGLPVREQRQVPAPEWSRWPECRRPTRPSSPEAIPSRKVEGVGYKLAGMAHPVSPHRLRHFLFTWLKTQGIDDALIQPYSGHASRQSLEVYSRIALANAQHSYEPRRS